MGLSDIVRTAEQKINEFGVRRTQNQGWVPTIHPYRGYGTQQRIHVIGRVLMEDPDFEQKASKRTVALEEAQRGYRQFFTVQVGDVPVRVHIGDSVVETFTNDNGYFDVTVDNHGLEPGWNTVTVCAEGAEDAEAEVLVTSDDVKIGLVSDVDDTVLVTNLPRAMHAAYNSWVKRTDKRQPVKGMSRFYKKLLEDHPDAPVFYLSTGAWNTYDTLVRFLEEEDLPKGPLLLTDWGPTPTGLFRNGTEHKKVQLRNLIIDYPDICWILVGDNGQHDPLTYGNLVAEHATKVCGVAIRELTPAEHVLSHGTTTSLTGPARTSRAGVPTISAPDGDALLAEYEQNPFVK
ncbi:App1 family protein [Corynebacterium tapiri]|uniref:DUF2183 domain-containing protein n=1 Tax=Corynebacterium tapiri TaxID=1448266 RepID=A0A5C4U3K7_9CORY|nr:phosphatase domain-containing protein [Corynebacterium tapiri]TNL96797.1 DUF2183 domain-containing protein [Corynebacterium tapiri]